MFQLKSPTTTQLHLYTRTPLPGMAAVAIAGEVDMTTAPALHAALVDVLTAHSPVVLDVDLSACTFLDCAGLTVLVLVHAAAQAAGCRLCITHPQGIVRRVLEMSGLLDVFTAPRGAPASVAAVESEPDRAAGTLSAALVAQ